MGRILRTAGIIVGLAAIVSIGFAFYSHFLVDYSLETLESALSATESKSLEAYDSTIKILYVR